MKKWIKKHSVVLIFVVFFLVLLFQHQFMGLYHDDYGYASLSYAYQVDGVNGHDLNFGQIMEFLKGHYEIWGGRILYFFVEICLISLGGISLYGVIQAIVITLIFYMIYKIVKRLLNGKVNDSLLALCSVMCYGIFEIMVIRTGIFWATASVLYLFPLLPFLMFIYLYDTREERNFKSKWLKILYDILCGFCIFISTFSQEQISAAALGYIVVVTGCHIFKERKLRLADAIMCLLAITGFVVLMIAPGNAIRQQHPTSIEFYSKPLLERVGVGIENLILGNFSDFSKMFNMVFYIAVAYASYQVLKEKFTTKWYTLGIARLSLLSTISIIFVTVLQEVGYFSFIYGLLSNPIYQIFVMGIFIIQLLLMLYSVAIYLYYKKQIWLIHILLSAIFSIGCMIVAPYFALRSALPFEILCFVFILYVLGEFYQKLSDKKIAIYFLLPIFAILVYNVLDITKGYYQNSVINRENDRILTEVSEKIKSGETVKEATLKKLPDLTYSGDQPYMEGNDYIMIYMKEYYDLPKDFNIMYE